MEFYEQLKKVRDGYAYPTAVHHQRDNGEASKPLERQSLFYSPKTDTNHRLRRLMEDPTRSNQKVTLATYWKEETPQRTEL